MISECFFNSKISRKFATFSVKTLSKVKHKYDIHIQGLDNKRYEYEFEGDDKFFAEFEQDLITKGKFKANITLDKSSTMIQLYFEISGSINLICDRSLEAFDEPIEISEKYIFKFGDKFEALSDEIEVVPFGTATINLMQHLYDFISLTVPMKKLHPRFRTEDEDDESYIYQTDADPIEEVKEEKPIDPRWAALLSLGKNK
jgi:uncharacterized metal-binding protein YceD (DUF177 family)